MGGYGFKPGDRVRVIGGNPPRGLTGEIIRDASYLGWVIKADPPFNAIESFIYGWELEMEVHPTHFGWALEQLKLGRLLARRGWNGKGMYVALQEPDEGSANTLPYLYVITVTGDRVPWVASQSDLLAIDWELVG